MKKKILICGMLLCLVLVSGCGDKYSQLCFEEIAEDFCKRNDCVVKAVYDSDKESKGFMEEKTRPIFYIYTNQWREERQLDFSEKEKTLCRNQEK